MSLNRPFNFTERDYAGIRSQMIEYVRTRVPEWTADPSDFAMVLIESMSHLGDMMSYYVDRAAGEASILTATSPRNVYSHARLLGYYPGLRKSARGVVRLRNTGTTTVTVPDRTTVSSQSGSLLYEVQGQVTLDPGEYQEVEVLEGRRAYVDLGASTGAAYQTIPLPDPSLDGRVGTLSVTTENPDTEALEYWTYTESLLDAEPGDYVFTVRVDPDGTGYVVFGDQYSGVIPPSGHLIHASYRTTVGSGGNSTGSHINRIVSSWDSDSLVQFSSVQVETVSPPQGGEDQETLDSVRSGAVNMARVQRRAVTSSDYESLLSADSSVMDVVCESSVWSRPTIWYLPTDQSVLSTGSLRDEMSDELTLRASAAAVMGVSPVCRPGTVIHYSADLEMVTRPGSDRSFSEKVVREILLEEFGYSGAALGNPITGEDIMAVLRDKSPRALVDFVRVTSMDRTDDSSSTAYSGAPVIEARTNEAAVMSAVNIYFSQASTHTGSRRR